MGTVQFVLGLERCQLELAATYLSVCHPSFPPCCHGTAQRGCGASADDPTGGDLPPRPRSKQALIYGSRTVCSIGHRNLCEAAAAGLEVKHLGQISINVPERGASIFTCLQSVTDLQTTDRLQPPPGCTI